MMDAKSNWQVNFRRKELWHITEKTEVTLRGEEPMFAEEKKYVYFAVRMLRRSTTKMLQH